MKCKAKARKEIYYKYKRGLVMQMLVYSPE